MSLGGILAEEIHKTPDKRLTGTTATPRQDPCRGPSKTLAEDIRGVAARPAPAKIPPPFPYGYQPTN